MDQEGPLGSFLVHQGIERLDGGLVDVVVGVYRLLEELGVDDGQLGLRLGVERGGWRNEILLGRVWNVVVEGMRRRMLGDCRRWRVGEGCRDRIRGYEVGRWLMR